jgi:catechol 2,3-dioxygenase-like lactoylglutathione lyase family enzyme
MQVCDHIGIFTRNLKPMKKFYMDVLGFSLDSESKLSGEIMGKIFGYAHDCHFIKLYKDGFLIELFSPISKESHTPGTRMTGLNHWGYCVADRRSFIEGLYRKDQATVEIDRNGRKVYFVIDPDGNPIEIRDYQR